MQRTDACVHTWHILRLKQASALLSECHGRCVCVSLNLSLYTDTCKLENECRQRIALCTRNIGDMQNSIIIATLTEGTLQRLLSMETKKGERETEWGWEPHKKDKPKRSFTPAVSVQGQVNIISKWRTFLCKFLRMANLSSVLSNIADEVCFPKIPGYMRTQTISRNWKKWSTKKNIVHRIGKNWRVYITDMTKIIASQKKSFWLL